MQLLIKRLSSTAQIPQRATEHSSCLDIKADENVTVPSGGRSTIGTGLAMAVPPGYEVQIRSRSGHASKSGVFVLNSPGTIDADYRGEVKVILANLGSDPFVVTSGMKIAQFGVYPVVMCPPVEVQILDSTDRGPGGFGHSGV